MNKKTKLAFKRLRDLHRKEKPQSRVPVYSDTKEKGLEKCIIDYLRLKGHHAERIHCSGRARLENGTIVYGKTTMNVGTADIHAIIDKLAVAIEIKIGKDRQSSYQKQYQKDVENAGGVYLIARNFVQFLEVIHQTTNIKRA